MCSCPALGCDDGVPLKAASARPWARRASLLVEVERIRAMTGPRRSDSNAADSPLAAHARSAFRSGRHILEGRGGGDLDTIAGDLGGYLDTLVSARAHAPTLWAWMWG